MNVRRYQGKSAGFFIGLCAVGLQIVISSCTVANAQQRGVAGDVPHEVLAFYYGWYGNRTVSGELVHWHLDPKTSKIVNSKDTPINGAYDSHDRAIIRKQVQEAKNAGITGFIVSWWGQDDFTDAGLPAMLEEAARVGLKVTVYVERFPVAVDALTVSKQVNELTYLIQRYSNSRAWLHVGLRPVIFIYASSMKAGGAQWRDAIARAHSNYPAIDPIFITDVSYGLSPEARKLSASYVSVFDGVHGYSIRGMRQKYPLQQNLEIARENFAQWKLGIAVSQITCDTVMPGFDDTTLTDRPLPRPTVLRSDGALYSALWQEAIADNPDWILIDSWSEWHEGTEIEPSVEYGKLYLDLTARYAHSFRALQAKHH